MDIGKLMGTGNYEAIINMTRPESRHIPMSAQARAAQFAPFAALTGFGGVIDEAGAEHDAEVASEVLKEPGQYDGQ